LIVGMLVGAAVLMGVFLVAELHQDDPMLDLSLFRQPAVVGVSLGSFTLSSSVFAMFLYLTLYLQAVLGYSPLQAGLRFLPITMLSFLVAPIAGKLTVRVQSRYMLGLGLFLVALGCSLMSRVQPDSTWSVLLPGFLVAGVGIGITNPVLASVSVSVVRPERSGMSTGSASTFRQVGLATGIAGLGAIFLSQIKGTTVTALSGSAAGQQVLAHGGQRVTAAITGSGVRQAAAAIPVASARHALLSAYRIGFTETLNHLMGIASVIAIVGAVGCLILVRQRDFVPSSAPVPDAPDAADGAVPTPVAEPAAVAPAVGAPADELPSAAPAG
jgi:Na+/melibiose symporter-like transporter